MFFRCCIHQGLPNSGSLEILCGSLRRQWTLAAPDHGPVLGLGDWAATKLGKSSLKGNSPQGGGVQERINKKLLLYIGLVLERMKGLIVYSTLQESNISTTQVLSKMTFLFFWWDMLVPSRVICF